MENCKQIFIYNKNCDLQTFVELKGDELNSYYNLQDRVLTKLNCFVFEEQHKTIQETKKAVIAFEEDCTLRHDYFDGESRVVASKILSSTSEPPQSNSKIYIANDTHIEGCTIQSSLINSWLQKL